MQCNTTPRPSAAITNNFGAFGRVEDECACFRIVMLDDIYDMIALKQYQIAGAAPKHCIPLTINAITVQGISYSDPYFVSFNINDKVALAAPVHMNKSDYAFNTFRAHSNECNRFDDSARTLGDNNAMSKEDSPVPKTFKNGQLTLSYMLELIGNEKKVLGSCPGNDVDSWGKPSCLRLCGGGETSLNSAAGWGSPPAPNNNAGNWGGNAAGQASNGTNNTQPQWNNGSQRPPVSQADSTNNSGNGNNSPNLVASTNGPTSANGTNGNSMSTSSAKIEQLNSMREALFSQDGWGGQHVNQDTNWDVPGSPEPGSKVEPSANGPPVWKPGNNCAFLGTDLWEANLRNGGQPPPQPVAKTPWGHTPTTNIGGTWGEDDDSAESANVWTGPPPQQQWQAGPPQHPQQWTAPKKDDWNAWGEPHRPDPRLEAHRSADLRQPPSELRPHDLSRGVTGRLNGDLWNQHHHAAPPAKMMPAGVVNQWGAQGPKDAMKGSGSGWEEPSPPAARRAPGFDDGTSLWAQRGGMGGMQGRAGPQGPPAQPRLPPGPSKPDAVWGAHAQRNGTWDEPHTSTWQDRDMPGWPEPSGPGLWQKPKPGWPEDEWGKHGGGPLTKQLPKEAIWNSKQFRLLVDMGYKKEEIEMALRAREMNAEEALELLAGGREAWRRDEFAGGAFPPAAPPPASPALVHKLLSQPPPQPVHHHHSYNANSGGGSGGGQPSTAQLRMLVQQIQMAVSAGYLNHQILNQPLAPQTLVLLNQLLQQIKVLQQLVQQHTVAISKGNSTVALQYSVQISKAKQQITALQNQIAAQQAMYMKQQGGSTELFKQSHDPLAQLQNNFADMALAKDSQPYGGGGQQSRLNQWKLPLDKDEAGGEFSRAPGAAKSATSPHSHLLQPDSPSCSTWGVGGRGEAWGEGDVADGKDAWPHAAHAPPVYDLVPEFEPGKPWKGSQLKNVEDDPAMTPGSVVRSPLSLAAIKDTELLGGKTSPERSLSSSTWSYQPTSQGGAGVKSGGDAWGSKPRAPPPAKPWPQHHAANAPPRAVPAWQASTWLLLKNLTAQIDGSTLKTLCLQHGPLLNFHLYLNQGFALARYSTREEAAKAQMALNNCVLSNTTIFAESPADSEVQMILQHLGSGAGGAWRGAGGAGGGAAGGKDAGWGAFPGPGLWPDQHDQRATPSSLNSYLPPDLLGGESI